MTLSHAEVDARMEAYDQAASSLEGDWFETRKEHEAGIIVARQIRAMAARWYRTTCGRVPLD